MLCTYVRAYVCMYVRMCVYISVHTYTHNEEICAHDTCKHDRDATTMAPSKVLIYGISTGNIDRSAYDPEFSLTERGLVSVLMFS